MTVPIGSVTPTHRIGDWIGVTHDGRWVVHTGKVELGQGIAAALMSVLATELGVDPAVVTCRPPSTSGPDEGYTAGSLSMSMSGTALRCAARALRHVMQTPEGASVTIGAVTPDHLAAEVLTVLAGMADGAAPAMPHREAVRGDLRAKVTGQSAYLHDMRLPGQVFGRVIRRVGQRPTADSVEIVGHDLAGHADLVTIVRDGTFIGVVARSEFAAMTLAAQLEAALTWELREAVIDQAGVTTAPTVHVDEAVPQGVQRHQLRVTRPHLLHASIGPACAMALWDEAGSTLQVWTHSQGIHPLRRELARALGVDPQSIRIDHVAGAGCYGHNGADDVAYDAALLARHVPGVPVHVTWSRAQELSCGPAGPSMEVEVAAETDAAGRLVAWEWSGTGEGHVCRPGMVAGIALLAHGDISGGSPMPASSDPDESIGGGIVRNARPLYDIPVRRLESTVRPSAQRTSAIRSLGAMLNVVATEALIEDIARHHGVDPVSFRLDHLSDTRARDVLLRACDLAGADPDTESGGRGIGLARYKGTGAWCAVIADVECVDRVAVTHLVVVADVGEIAHRDGVLHQLEGGAVQSLSWTLHERAPVRNNRIAALGWSDYPIARFTDVPRVTADVLDRSGEPYLGAGEAAAGPTAAALCNAVTAALGLRIPDLPLTPETIVRALR